jgi:hypothetical protein
VFIAQTYQGIIIFIKINVGKDEDAKAPDIVPEVRDLQNWVSI